MAAAPRLGEFARIARFFAPLAGPGGLGLRDDAALLDCAPGNQLVVTVDAIVAGVHYLPDDPPDLVARKLLRVNLSDLAAMGARPLHYLLATALPASLGDEWVSRFRGQYVKLAKGEDNEAEAKRRLSDIQRRALDLLVRCINDYGSKPPPTKEFPPLIRIVRLEEWRIMCERGALSSAPEKEERDRVFWQAKDGLQTLNWIACLDGVVWIVRDD